MMRALQKLLTPIRRRIMLLLSRGIGRLANSAVPHQRLQIELIPGEVLDDIEHLEPYGFTSHPLPGHEVIAASIGGERSRVVVVIAADRRNRKKGLAPGESAMYTDEGDYILMKRGRIIEVVAGARVKVTAPDVEVVASTKVTITSPLTAISGNLTVGGTAQVTGQITGQGGIAVSGGSGAQVSGNVSVTGGNVTADGIGLKTHVHGGVQPGSGTTGAPQ